MKVRTLAEQRKLKTRFVIIYAVSLALVFVVMSAFWKKLNSVKTAEVPAVVSEKETYFMQLDTALHTQLAQFDAVSKTYLQSRQSGAAADAGALYFARNSFSKMLDSIDQGAAYLSEGPKKEMMSFAAAKFRRELETRENMLNSVVALPKIAPVVSDTSNADNEVEALKRQLQEKDAAIATLQSQAQAGPPQNGSAGTDAQIQNALAEKDKLIASLQTQLKQKETALRAASASPKGPAPGGGEWQQKYLSLKSAYDKVSASEKSLKSAYQTLADDNRRLLSQLQSARKG